MLSMASTNLRSETDGSSHEIAVPKIGRRTGTFSTENGSKKVPATLCVSRTQALTYWDQDEA